MKTTIRIPSAVAAGGWILGVTTAVCADYWLLPHLLTRFQGRRAVPVLIGLLVGVGLMWSCVELSRRLAQRLAQPKEAVEGKPAKVRKSPAEHTPLPSRIMIAVLALLIVGGMILGIAPPASYVAP